MTFVKKSLGQNFLQDKKYNKKNSQFNKIRIKKLLKSDQVGEL